MDSEAGALETWSRDRGLGDCSELRGEFLAVSGEYSQGFLNGLYQKDTRDLVKHQVSSWISAIQARGGGAWKSAWSSPPGDCCDGARLRTLNQERVRKGALGDWIKECFEGHPEKETGGVGPGKKKVFERGEGENLCPKG